jgi:hypothetical protein
VPTIEGYEAMHAIRKGQARCVDAVAQRQFLHTIFGIAAKIHPGTHAVAPRAGYLQQNTVHSIATDSKWNTFTTETYRGQRVHKSACRGLAVVTKKDQGVVWPRIP